MDGPWLLIPVPDGILAQASWWIAPLVVALALCVGLALWAARQLEPRYRRGRAAVPGRRGLAL